jgi:DHA2 family multidrug resistance protein
LGLINAPLMSTALNAVRREQTAVASGLLTVIMQVGGAFGVALLGAIFQRREFFHYAHSLGRLADSFPISRAQQGLQDLLLNAGHAPAEVLAKGKILLASWLQRLSAASGFADAFVFAALIISIGIIPAMLIRNPKAPAAGKAAEPGKGQEGYAEAY